VKPYPGQVGVLESGGFQRLRGFAKGVGGAGIFRLACDRRGALPAVAYLACVCRDWRDAVRREPALWMRVDLSFGWYVVPRALEWGEETSGETSRVSGGTVPASCDAKLPIVFRVLRGD
jgi:hypothetical protein